MAEQAIESTEVDGTVDVSEHDTPDETTPEPEAEAPSNVVALRPDQPQATGVGSLTITPDQTSWTLHQWQALCDRNPTLLPEDGKPGSGVSQGEARAFLHICQASGLDPFRNEIYFVGRWDRNDRRTKFTAQTGIDGFRTLAERTGEYAGGEDPAWCADDGVWKDVWLSKKAPAAARAGVKRRQPDGTIEVTRGIAVYEEYAPSDLTATWRKMPSVMLHKCAAAQAFRTAFPRQTHGIYVHEEMHQADRVEAEIQADAGRARRREARANATRARDIIEGEVIAETPAPEPATEATHEALFAEVVAQAEVLGKPVAALHRRWAAAHGRVVADATVEELTDLVRSMRGTVAEALRQGGKAGIADRYAAATAPVVDLAAMLAGPAPAGEGEHPFVGDPEESPFCVRCGDPHD
jgi:phage recombination protein Bet